MHLLTSSALPASVPPACVLSVVYHGRGVSVDENEAQSVLRLPLHTKIRVERHREGLFRFVGPSHTLNTPPVADTFDFLARKRAFSRK